MLGRVEDVECYFAITGGVLDFKEGSGFYLDVVFHGAVLLKFTI